MHRRRTWRHLELRQYETQSVSNEVSSSESVSRNRQYFLIYLRFSGRYVKRKPAKVMEAILVAIITATVACIMMYTISDCRPLGNDPTSYPVQLFCQDNEYNAGVALWFQTPEASVKSLFHDPPGSHRLLTLLVFVMIYWPLSCVTYGLNVSLGIFIPTLLIGAAWGRLISMLFALVNPKWVSN